MGHTLGEFTSLEDMQAADEAKAATTEAQPATITLRTGVKVTPIATFNDGNSHIIVDDHCYVIVNKTGDYYDFSPWIFPKALEVLKGLASPSESIINATPPAEPTPPTSP
jgi:hypothetical protein